MNKPNILVVISYFDERPLKHLYFLLETIRKYDAGCSFDICLVINKTSRSKIEFEVDLTDVKVLERQNIGMNIGAWDYAWRTFRSYDYYLFLQDECYVIRKKWLSTFYKKIKDDKSIGMIGESFNHSWNHPWDRLRIINSGINMPDHRINSQVANRVDVYIDFMHRNKVNPHNNGAHLRSLVWFIGSDTLKEIDGFPLGMNYGECIASEISVSKKIESIGLKVVQLKKTPFYFIRHFEWNQNKIDGPFIHETAFIDMNFKNSNLSKVLVFKAIIDKLKKLKIFLIRILKTKH